MDNLKVIPKKHTSQFFVEELGPPVHLKPPLPVPRPPSRRLAIPRGLLPSVLLPELAQPPLPLVLLPPRRLEPLLLLQPLQPPVPPSPASLHVTALRLLPPPLLPRLGFFLPPPLPRLDPRARLAERGQPVVDVGAVLGALQLRLELAAEQVDAVRRPARPRAAARLDPDAELDADLPHLVAGLAVVVDGLDEGAEAGLFGHVVGVPVTHPPGHVGHEALLEDVQAYFFERRIPVQPGVELEVLDADVVLGPPNWLDTVFPLPIRQSVDDGHQLSRRLLIL
ncbi:hypothetical protein PG999_010248 [Apiospora kogelbergensis]|uniref:Uncharacterized protein n=1 Tax=Apiospora kogelbergensis TaxID=1337665 RepID=A0AAW0QKK2_9PEZI